MVNDNKIPTKNLTNLKSPMFNTNKGTGDQKNINIKDIDKWKKQLVTPKPLSLDAKKGKAELEKAGKNSRVTLDFIQANKQNANAKQNANKCSSFCRVKGFNIVPLRYSVTLDKKNPLPSNLGKNVKDIALSKFGYTVEMVNNGYIYCLTKRAKSGFKGNWSGYKVTPKGFLSYFVVEKNKPAPADVNEFACQNASHQFAGSVITIEERTSDPATEAYIIYTQAPMSDAKRAEYEKSADAFVSQAKWQKVKIGGGASQEHCFGEGQINSAIYNLKKFGDNRIKLMKEKFKSFPNAFVCMGLYDAIGITRKLNDTRNLKSFGDMQRFLEEKKNGFTNQHRMQSLSLIENMQDTITNSYITVKSKNIVNRNLNISNNSALDLRKRSALEAAKRVNDKVRIEQLEREIAQTTHNRVINQNNELDQIQTKGNLKGNEAWKKYQEQLDLDGIDKFKKKMNEVSAEAFNKASEYENDHIKWLKSNNLLNSLYIFDQQENLSGSKLPEASNGFIFHTIVMDFMHGMTFLKNGQDIIDKWINEKSVKNENLYLRGYCFNNKNLIEHYNNTFTSDTTGKTVISNTKKIVSAFKAADEAFDKWLVAVEGKQFILSHEFKASDKLFYWMSLGLNSLFKTFSSLQTKTISVGSITAVATEASKQHAVQLYYLRSGELVNKIPLNNLFFNLDFKKAAESAVLKNEKYKNPWILSTGKDIDLVVKQQPKITQNRILAIVGIVELLNFYFQYGAWKKDTINNPEYAVALTGSLFSLSSVTFKLLGENAASISVGEKVAGHMKIAAASFGVLAGVAGLIIDAKKMQKGDNSKLLYSVLAIRFLSGLGIVVSQIGSLLISLSSSYAFMQKQGIQKVVTSFTKNMIVAWLMGARVVAGLNILTVSLIGVEIALRKWVLDDAMEDWCQKSAFRKNNSKETPFKNENDEFKGFSEALVSII